MNERIRQLADEAKMSTYLLAYGLEFNISIEKFAELIVQECIDVAFDRGDNVDYFKEHFGVES
jgi:hypothetical protein